MKKKLVIIGTFLIFLAQIHAQERNNRIPLIGEKAPSFTAQSTLGKINFPKDFGSDWKIIFAHPKDFTPVCSSEILELALQQEEYKKLGVRLIVLSTDIISQHKDWIAALEEIKYKGREPVKIKFPLVDDSRYLISNKYGLIHSSTSISENIRAVYIIDPENKVRSISFYPIELGRNMDEIKRTVVALQTIDKNNNHISTPANWNPGDKVMVPVLTEEEQRKLGTSESKIQQLTWFMNYRSVD
jgi:peroxiredoxin 2/4